MTERRFSFEIPDTDQGGRVMAAMDDLFRNRLPGTAAETLFAHMDESSQANHQSQLGGALIAAANGELTSDAMARLTSIHKRLHMSGEQYDVTTNGVVGALQDAGEAKMAQTLVPIVSVLRPVFVTEAPS